MTINLIALTVSLISLGILFFVLIRLRDNSQLTQSKTDKIEEKEDKSYVIIDFNNQIRESNEY